MASDTEAGEQGALFHIEGPDEDGCVWAIFKSGTVENMGPRGPVAEVLVAKLGEWDYGERVEDWQGVKPVDEEPDDL